ncbi:FAD-dependent oxidoreductase [Pseudomonas amygdali pv. morsprunorum]|nr:FAD-dependent oxidoreductase [Pseudomonas amygdali pv. morsprunorum]
MGLTRREALSSIAAVGGEKAVKDALAVLGLGPSSHRRPKPLKLGSGLGQGTRVLVLGAGIAGLVTALELTRAGFTVQVLEARDRVGGRNWTLRSGDQVDYKDGRTQTVGFDPGLYFNAGPARIPSQHRTLLDYCSELGCRLKCWSTAAMALRSARTCNSPRSLSARLSTTPAATSRVYWPRRCSAMLWTMC